MLLPLLPLRDKVLFPGDFGPLFEPRPSSQAAIDFATAVGGRVAVVTQKVTEAYEPRPHEVHAVGTLGIIVERTDDDDVTRIVLESKERVRIHGFAAHRSGLFRRSGFYLVDTTLVSDAPRQTDDDLQPLIRAVFSGYDELRRRRGLPPEAMRLLEGAQLDQGESLTRMALHYLALGDSRHFIPLPRRQALLETPSLRSRLELLAAVLAEEARKPPFLS